MRGKLTIIGVDGVVTTTEVTTSPTLEQMQEAVGGYIERVPYLDSYQDVPCIAFCNEEGKNKNMPYNPTAQQIWVEAVRKTIPSPLWDTLVGPILILTGDEEFMDSL